MEKRGCADNGDITMDLTDTEKCRGTIAWVLMILTTRNGAKRNTTDILGYTDPTVEAEWIPKTSDGVASTPLVKEGT